MSCFFCARSERSGFDRAKISKRRFAPSRWRAAPRALDRHARPTRSSASTAARRRRSPGPRSASIEWLVRHLAPSFPGLAFLEVRYRIKSRRRLDSCVEDGRAAIEAARASGAERVAMLAFSMGGAVAVRNAAAPEVSLVAGINPWLPPELELELVGRRLAIVHGALDAPLPGIPA